MMDIYTSQQRVEIIKIDQRNSASVASTLRALHQIYGHNNRPSRSTIQRLVKNFESTCVTGQTAIHTYSMSHAEKITASLGRTSSVNIQTGTFM